MFGFHPVSLGVRFVLEVAAFLSIGVGAYSLADGLSAWLLAVMLPLVAAVVWALFNVPGDKSRSGAAPVPVFGWVRLFIELGIFVVAVSLLSLVSPAPAMALGTAVVIHYLVSIDRIRWLLAS